jgi:hypothetical protein
MSEPLIMTRPMLAVVGTPHWRWRVTKRSLPEPWPACHPEDERALRALGLRGGVLNALLRYRLSIDDVAAMPNTELLRLRNVGRVGVAQIRAKVPYRGAPHV